MRQRAVLAVALVVLGAGLVAWQARDGDDGSQPAAPATTTSASPATAPPVVGTAGAPGVGDPYFPGLGNGGYDVEHYDVDLDWRPDAGTVRGIVRIEARALHDLSRFNLDLAGMEVFSVTVDDVAAETDRRERELEITPAAPIPDGATFTTVVSYSGVPRPLPDGTDLFEVGWHTDGREAFVVSEPAGTASFLPVNDHPSDKATYTFHIQAPTDQVVAANGVLAGEPVFVDEGSAREWTYVARDPMASYLVQIAIGDYELVDGGTFGDVTIRHAFHRSIADQAQTTTERTIEMMDLLDDVWGPYPFEAYGVLAVDEPLGFALETQTLTIIGTDIAVEGRRADAILLHELAHQWVGNAVSPATWKDVWLNEGFATYSEWLWSERTGGPSAARRARVSAEGLDLPPGDPGPDELFQLTVYVRGAMTLQALREAIGDDDFFTVLRTWIDEHRDDVASTQDLIDLAERVSGDQLDELFAEWLYAPTRPRLPEL